MIVSTDQQAFSVTILVKAEEEDVVKVKQEQEESEVEMVEARGHEGLVLEGLAGLREQGLLLDTRLWAESQSFQVNQKGRLFLKELLTHTRRLVVFLGGNGQMFELQQAFCSLAVKLRSEYHKGLYCGGTRCLIECMP